MIDAIINFFTDNHINLGVSKFLMYFINFKRLIVTSQEINDDFIIEQIKTQFKILISSTNKIKRLDSISFLLLIHCPNTDKWEIIAIDTKYKYIYKVMIETNLLNSDNADTYYIKLQ